MLSGWTNLRLEGPRRSANFPLGCSEDRQKASPASAGEAFEQHAIEAPRLHPLRLRGWCGRVWRSRFGCRSSRLHRIILVVETDNFLSNIDLVRGIDHRSLLRRSIEDKRVIIFLRILVEYFHHLAADAVYQFLLGIVEIVLRFLLLALIRASHLVAFARQTSFFLVTQRCLSRAQSGLEFFDLLAHIVKFGLPGSELGLQLRCRLFSLCRTRDRHLYIDNTDFRLRHGGCRARAA